MKKTKYMLWAGTLALSLLLHQKIVAQSSIRQINTPSSIELTNSLALWLNTQNAAGLSIDRMNSFNEASLLYAHTNGKYKMNAEGEKERLFGFNTSGSLVLGQMYLWGDFSYGNEYLTNTLFNTNQIKVRRNMPYFVADPNMSDWTRQTYHLNMKAASQKLFDVLNLGLNMEYQNQVGAKQMDPRSSGYNYEVTVKPALLFNFATNHNLGLTGIYYNYKSNSSTTNSDTQVNQLVYVLKGMGFYYEDHVGGMVSLNPFNHTANQLGGELAYGFHTGNMDLVLTAAYSKKIEDIIQSPTRPQMEGSVIEKNTAINLQALFKGSMVHKFSLSYDNNQIDGVQYVQELDRTYEVQQWITKFKSIRSSFADKDFYAGYDVLAGVDAEYKWRAGVFFNHHILSDIYYLPLSTMDWKSTTLGIQAKYNANLGNNSRLLIGANFALKNVNDNAKYVYTGPNPNSPVIKEFFEKDFAMAVNNNTKIGGEVALSIPVRTYTSLYLKAVYDYYKASKIDVTRTCAHFALGIIF